MAVTPGLPKIGEQAYQEFLDGQTVDIMLFHDGNQSGNVQKPIQAVDTATNTIEVNNNIRFDAPRGGFLTISEAFDIVGSTGNDGAYTVSDMTFNFETERTEITVNESIGDGTVDGKASFGDANLSGRGDNLRDDDRLADITTEPDDGGYTRATNQSIEKFDDGDDWFIRTVNDTVFDNLNDTTGRVDAVSVLYNWQADGDGSAQDHILFTAFLDQLYLLDQTDKHTVDANTIRLALR